MFVYDVETLGKETNAVILSMACTYFEPAARPSFQELIDNTFFVKLNAEDQIKRHKRGITKSSLTWWGKQCEMAKKKSLYPSADDVLIEDGIEQFRTWAKQYDDGKSWVWARGNLDQMVLDSFEETLGIEPVFYYNRWRDVRTAIDLLCGVDNGYCDVVYDGFDPFLNILKHDPVYDCVYDAMMLLYGKEKG